MRVGLIGFLAALAVSTFGDASLARACSLGGGYVRPSNFELVQIADAIVIATPAADQPPRDGGDPFGSEVRFRVERVLKGEVGAEVQVRGLRLGRTRPSDPTDIRVSHPEGHMGPCNRVTMTNGASYLLFLGRQNGVYATLGYPFSRVSEDYAGDQSNWGRTVQAYLGVQAKLTPMAQVQTLADMRAAMLAQANSSAFDKALAADIADHLGSNSPWKPTAFLLAAYDDAHAGRSPRFPPRRSDFDQEQSGAEAMTDAVMERLVGKPKAQPAPKRSAYEQRILESLISPDHPDARALFEGFARPEARADEVAMAIRYFALTGAYPRSFELIDTRVPDLLAGADRVGAEMLLRAVGEAQQDPPYGEDAPRWRSLAASQARWPDLALRITTIAQARFGLDPDYEDTLMARLGTDYRANPQLTVALSGKSNEITGWAMRELAAPENLRAGREYGGTPADPLILPLEVTLRWHGLSGDDDDPIIIGVFCNGPAQRRTIFETWGRLGGGMSVLTIMRLAASPEMEAADRELLAAAIPEWDRRHQQERGESWLAADKAMQKLARREPITARDIKPLKPAVCPAS